MPLNHMQQEAFHDVISFINSDRKYHFISGGAGVGKTYFISKVAENILKHCIPSKPLFNVQITATTNKAVAVIHAACQGQFNIQTVYSFLNLRVSENYSDGSTSCVPTGAFTVYGNILLIIDECSMVNKQLMEYIEKATNGTCKILFVGDKNQLAPVKETLSQIFRRGYSASYLTKPVRNAEQPALMALCEQVKKTVETGIFTPIVEVPGVIDIMDGRGVKDYLDAEYTAEDPSKRILAYTNDKVINYNNYVRQIRGYTRTFETGEIVSNNSSCEFRPKVTFYADQMFEIVKTSAHFPRKDIVNGQEIMVIPLTVKDVNNGLTYEFETFMHSEDRKQVLKYYANNKKWHKYFGIKNKFPDLRSVAASTVHKAQGSTYDSVVVDLADIGKCTQRETTARLQYVALSRPKKRVVIRGELPPRYFN